MSLIAGKQLRDNTVTASKVAGSVLSTDGANTPPGVPYDALGERITNVGDPTGPTDALNVQSHDALRKLIHLADGVGGPFEGFASGAYRVILPAADPFPTTITWWESVAMLKRICDKVITYNPNKTPATIQYRAYDTDGVTVLVTVTDTMTYTAVFETSRVRTIV
jgi:hypothetical protein